MQNVSSVNEMKERKLRVHSSLTAKGELRFKISYYAVIGWAEASRLNLHCELNLLPSERLRKFKITTETS